MCKIDVPEINIRFRELRKNCQKSQTEWGKILGISRPGVCDIEAGRRNVTDKHIKLLCIEPINGKYINESWLRTGNGEMFVDVDKEEELVSWFSKITRTDFDNQFIPDFIHMLSKLNEKDWETIQKMAEIMIANRKTD